MTIKVTINGPIADEKRGGHIWVVDIPGQHPFMTEPEAGDPMAGFEKVLSALPIVLREAVKCP